jgi:DinB superfamily
MPGAFVMDRAYLEWLAETSLGWHVSDAAFDRQAVHDELERARAAFHALVEEAPPAELRRPSQGTRWTNQQLLFHMLFGYLIVRTLLGLVRTFGRLPDRFSRVFAWVLSAGTRPFHVVNYLGSCGGALVFRGPRLISKFDRAIASLHRRLDRETDQALGGVMHFPEAWDPYFADRMRLFDVYRYGTQHFEHHRRQLTLENRVP